MRLALQIVLLVGIAFILLRLFPIFMRLSATTAVSIVKFWWVILAIALLIWLVWVFSKRNSPR